MKRKCHPTKLLVPQMLEDQPKTSRVFLGQRGFPPGTDMTDVNKQNANFEPAKKSKIKNDEAKTLNCSLAQYEK